MWNVADNTLHTTRREFKMSQKEMKSRKSSSIGKQNPSKSKPKARATSRAITSRKPATKAKLSASKTGVRDAEDWRGETLYRMRALILEAEPEMIEEQKWKK